ncbi:MAG: efflux RND transporter periplasmic adaptor subunit [Desulfobaccales bacterium]
MIPSPRRSLFRGLGLGIVLCLLVLGGLYLAGYQFMHMGPSVAPGQVDKKAICWISPKNPDFVQFQPGKDPEGHELVPVYPMGTPGAAAPTAPPAARKIKHWVSSMDPKFVSDKPGKDPMGMDLVPVYQEGAPAAAPPAAAAKGEAQQLWRCPMHPEIVRNAPGKCPICGMDLVPVPGTGAAAPGAPATGTPVAKKEKKIKYWVSPMDPGFISDKPGKAPCGMDLVPVYEEEGGEAAPGAIAVSPTTVQSMGVRTAKAEVQPLTHDTWTVGRVTFNERSLAIINTKVAGWVERLYINATGDPVRKGQTLLSIYSPDLVSTQKEYLLALKNLKTLGKSPFPELGDSARNLLEASRRRLQYFDISAGQIAALEKTGQVKKLLSLSSPVKGIVTKRMVTQGQMVQAGMPLLEVADLSTVWVDADIYQYELPWIKAGQQVEMSLQYMPGETFQGKIDYIYPYLKEDTRTAKVRLRFPNPQLKLKPEMFAQVQIKSPAAKEAVVVPAEAVLDTGLKQHVFIALGGGKFEPREVKLGVYGNGNHYREVLSGLKGGEDVVTSAQFLLDSESRFREAIQMMLPPQGAPAAGKEAAPQAMPGTPGTKPETPKEAAPAAPAPPGHKH